MLQIPAEILAMSAEPALLAKNGKILFANAAACALFGGACCGKSLRAVLGEELAGIQAGSYLGELEHNGRRYLLRTQTVEGMQALFLQESRIAEELINDAFLVSLRQVLMELQMSGTLLRNSLEQELGRDLGSEMGPFNRSFFRISRILSNMTVVRGAGSGELTYLPQVLDLAVFLRDLADSMSVLFSAPELRMTLPEVCPCRADPGLLESLILNLISNCLRHAKGATRISLRLSCAGDRVLLSVDDDGCGIPAEEMHTVFDRFRHRYALEELGKGAGLGLTAVREIARLHGGTLMLESRGGRGTNVRVSLRCALPTMPLSAGGESWERSYGSILTGLADCLETNCFSGLLTE